MKHFGICCLQSIQTAHYGQQWIGRNLFGGKNYTKTCKEGKLNYAS